MFRVQVFDGTDRRADLCSNFLIFTFTSANSLKLNRLKQKSIFKHDASAQINVIFKKSIDFQSITIMNLCTNNRMLTNKIKAHIAD